MANVLTVPRFSVNTEVFTDIIGLTPWIGHNTRSDSRTTGRLLTYLVEEPVKSVAPCVQTSAKRPVGVAFPAPVELDDDEFPPPLLLLLEVPEPDEPLDPELPDEPDPPDPPLDPDPPEPEPPEPDPPEPELEPDELLLEVVVEFDMLPVVAFASCDAIAGFLSIILATL